MNYDFYFFVNVYFIFGISFASIRMILSIPKLTEIKKSFFFQGGTSPILFWIGISIGIILETFFWPVPFTKVLITGEMLSKSDGYDE